MSEFAFDPDTTPSEFPVIDHRMLDPHDTSVIPTASHPLGETRIGADGQIEHISSEVWEPHLKRELDKRD